MSEKKKKNEGLRNNSLSYYYYYYYDDDDDEKDGRHLWLARGDRIQGGDVRAFKRKEKMWSFVEGVTKEEAMRT